jgi:hypothetical protein
VVGDSIRSFVLSDFLPESRHAVTEFASFVRGQPV